MRKERILVSSLLFKLHFSSLNGSARPQGFVETPLAYDAVWALAFALDKAEKQLKRNGSSLRNFTYDNQEVYDVLYQAMEKTDFIGISVSVVYTLSQTFSVGKER